MERVYQWVLKHQNRLQPQPPDLAWQQRLHQTIHKVSEDIQSLKYNTAIAALMSYFKMLQAKLSIAEVELKSYLLMLAPFAPHLTEELWQQLGESGSIHQQKFPQFNPQLLITEQVTVAVQINGRTRTTINLSPNASQEEAIAAARHTQAIQRHLNNQEVHRAVYVPGRILNFVT
ncbi:class I tRNA ligase family protein [Nostoc sp.]|uniref:class I tRNA ligase family protein n=1 Tax=Nostoc sp. TaxID=1180 RepID=UPI003FA57390